MNPDLLIILCAVGVVALIYVIRYILTRFFDKADDAFENKLKRMRAENHPAQNQSLAARLGVQTPPAAQSNQIPSCQSQPVSSQPNTPADIQRHPAQGQAAAFCVKCGAPVKPGSSFCARCGAKVKKN